MKPQVRLTQEQIAHIRTLEDDEGRLTPAQIVADARERDSPLHALFDWNKARAAEKWWLHQARTIIASVTLQVQTSHAVIKAPHYVVDTAASGAGYRSVVSLQKDPISARESLVYTLEVASGHLRRAYDLAGPLGMQDEIGALVERVTGLRMEIASKAA